MARIAPTSQQTRPTNDPDASSVMLPLHAGGEDDDLLLIRRVAAHDRQAFEALYYRYARRLAEYLSKLLKQQEILEEVVDDVMLVVWRNATRFDSTSRVSTWIFGIAHNKAMKALSRGVN